MHEIEKAIGRRRAAVVTWISPAIKNVAATSTRAARVGRRLRGGGGMIDDQHFAERARAEENLVAHRVVVNRIAVAPVAARNQAEIDVDEFGVIRDHAVVGQRGIHILNQVIPHVPTPDDVVGRCSRGLDFKNGVRPELRRDRLSAGRLRLGERVRFPHDAEDVAVWHRTHIVVLLKLGGRHQQVVGERAGGAEDLDAAAARRAAEGAGRVHGRTNERAIAPQIAHAGAARRASPTSNDCASRVDGVGGGAVGGGEQRPLDRRGRTRAPSAENAGKVLGVGGAVAGHIANGRAPTREHNGQVAGVNLLIAAEIGGAICAGDPDPDPDKGKGRVEGKGESKQRWEGDSHGGHCMMARHGDEAKQNRQNLADALNAATPSAG